MPIAKVIQKIPRWIIGFSFCFLNVLLLVIIHGSRGWTMHNPQMDLISSGLWVLCSRKYGCRSMKSADVYLTLVRVFMTFGLLHAVLAMLFSIDWNRISHCKLISLPKYLVAGIFSFLAGFCMLAAVLIFQIRFNNAAHFVDPSQKWPFFLSWVVCILCFLSGIYNVLNYKWIVRITEESAVQDEHNIIPPVPL